MNDRDSGGSTNARGWHSWLSSIVGMSDLSRHAELAWRFVRWAVQVGGADVRAALREAFERTLTRFEGATPLESIHEQRLEAHGILSERRKHTLRAQIMNEVVRPALASLLA